MIETIETPRLILFPITPEDVDRLLELDRDPEVMRYLTGRPSTRDEVVAAIDDSLGSRWTATERATGAFVGWFGLVPRSNDAYELGYRLAREWWGQGLATEGSLALVDAAFRRLDASRVTAEAMAVNTRSRAVMQRLGMQHVRTFHREWEDPLPGTEGGEVEYELVRDAWRRAQLR
jgi:RimJ/RimL family protein N-acetyltransferase